MTLFRSGGQRQLLQRWLPGRWTQELAADFTSGLDVVARRVMFQVWRAGAAGIHRNTLCQRTDLSPGELRSVLMRMGHVLRRFQRERGMALSRLVAANSPLQSYFVNAEFAVVASDLFGERMPDQLSSGLMTSLTNACHTALGRMNRASVVEHAAADCRPVGCAGLRR